MPHATPESPSHRHDVVVIDGGAAGIAMTASLLKRRGDLDIAIVEPAEMHRYQPGWTLVGGGLFSADISRRPMADVIRPSRAARFAVIDASTLESLEACRTPASASSWPRSRGQ